MTNWTIGFIISKGEFDPTKEVKNHIYKMDYPRDDEELRTLELLILNNNHKWSFPTMLTLDAGGCRESLFYTHNFLVKLYKKLKRDKLLTKFNYKIFVSWSLAGDSSPTGGYERLTRTPKFESIIEDLIDRLESKGYDRIEYKKAKRSGNIILYFTLDEINAVVSSFFGLLIKSYLKFTFLKSGRLNLLRTLESSGWVSSIGIIPPGLFTTLERKRLLEGGLNLEEYSGIDSYMRAFIHETDGKLLKSYIEKYKLNSRAYKEFTSSFLKRLGIKDVVKEDKWI